MQHLGAGTTVLLSVLDFASVVGNTGRQIGWICKCTHRLPMAASVAERPSHEMLSLPRYAELSAE